MSGWTQTAVVVVAALIALTAVVFIVTLVLFRMGVCREYKNRFVPGELDVFAGFRDKMEEELAWFKSMGPEVVSVRSFDGLTLSGQYLASANSRGVILLMNGYRSLGSRDFACALRLYNQLGFDVLLPDQRACGSSEGKYITFGALERRDCVTWAEYAAGRFGIEKPLFLSGISMGATTVLCAAALGLPESVRGIIADCGFTSPRAIMESVARRMLHLPPFPFLNIAGLLCRRIAGFGLDDCSTVDAMRENDIPVLFVHGSADKFVPCEMTAAAYEACRAKKRLFIAEGAGHGQSFFREREEYTRLAEEFFSENI